MKNKQNECYGKIIPSYSMNLFDEALRDFLHQTHEMSFIERLKKAASYFLGESYVWEPLGEGPQGKYDQAPLYRTDQFDCVTFTNTILALARSQNLLEFKKALLQIRYLNDEITYTNR